jgi:hypothetical protein
VSLALRDGAIVGLTNRLTGEQLAAPPRDWQPLANLYLTRERTYLSDSGRVTTARTGRGARAGLRATVTWPGKGSLTTDCVADGQAFRIQQSAMSKDAGLYAASLGIARVPEGVRLLVPATSGQCFDSRAPWLTHVFDYPIAWEAPFVILQGQRGGVLIHAKDPHLRPKTVFVQRTAEGFRVRLESRNEAPFDNATRLKGIPWHVVAYRGNWQVGTALYRSWAERAYGLKPLQFKRPRWVTDIRLVVIMPLSQEVLRALGRHVDPRQTLLYVPDWRRDGYDRNYPDYTARPEFGPIVEEAHRMGFRVMAHVNYLGCDVKNPEYERLKRYHIRDPLTKEPLHWEWPAEPPIKFAYINPASREWRKLFVERMVELVQRYKVDALHLDQTLCIYNDDNGRIDGMSCAEGNVAIHRELKAALPEVALSGEGLNEITCRYEDFAQRHAWGTDPVNGTWSDRLLVMSHPVSSAVLLPYTKMYGYLGMPNPVVSPALLSAFERAYEPLGVLPTYASPTVAELTPEVHPAVHRVLRHARVFFRYRPEPDFASPWAPDELFVWKIPGGGRLRYVRKQGVSLQLRTPGGKAYETIAHRIEGTETFDGRGSIEGWPAFGERALIGLDPRRQYEWSPVPTDPNALHLRSVPRGWHVSLAGNHDELFRVGLESHEPERLAEVRLWERGLAVRCGVEVPKGRSVSLQTPDFYDEPSGGTVQPDGQGLFIHPPYRGIRSGTPTARPPHSFVEYTLRLPDAPNLRFEAHATLKQGANRSDGVRFTVRARPTDGGDEASADVLAVMGELRPLRLDLERLRRRSVVLRIEADAGPSGDPSFDWANLDKPRVIGDAWQMPPVPAALILGGRQPVERVLTAWGSAKLRQTATGTVVETTLPNVLIVPKRAPVELRFSEEGQEGLRLLGIPFGVRTRSEGGIEHAGAPFPVEEGTGTCGGVTRTALSAHPPTAGCTLVDYHVRLPERPCRLETAMGIGDGSRSTGVGFRVEVNGQVVFSQDVRPGSGWIPVNLDLSGHAGQEIVLTLVTDALGGYHFDWAVWADPVLVPSGALSLQ